MRNTGLEETQAGIKIAEPVKIFDSVCQTNCGKLLKLCKYQTILPASWEICMQLKMQQLEPDMQQQTVPKMGKVYVKAVYCHPAYLTYNAEYIMWNARMLEAQAGIKIAWININNLRYADDTTLMTKSKEEL